MDKDQILNAALKHGDAQKRSAFLDDACRNDAALRIEIEQLMRQHEATGSLATEPALVQEGSIPIPRDEALAAPGVVVAGRYKLLEEIGEGGMGTVWVAQQTEPVRRRIALKLIKPGMDSRQMLSRFEAERQALALMDHPNIAKVFDGGVTSQGRPFFVMEYVKGVPLNEFCDQTRLTVEQRLRLFVQVCQAVQHAHQKGIIHRDLKPSNILVCLYDGHPMPKIIDFGLAKALHQPLTEHTLYTAHGMMVGTPLYMSPEQAEFNNLDIDTRTDVYSLGVIMYELLTGTTPLDRKRFKDAAWQEILRLIKEEEPAKPSTRLSGSGSLPSVAAQRSLEPAQLSRIVRGDLDWIVMKALEKERSRRYETASDLARDIERYLADEPVEARRPTRTYRLRKFIRRNRGAVLAGATVVVALITGLVVASAGFLQARRQARIAHTQAARSEQVAQFLKDMLNGLDHVNLQGRDTSLLREILEKSAERVGTDLSDEPEVQSDLLETIGNIYCHIGPMDKAEATQREALAIRSRVLGEEHLKVASSLDGLALVLWRQGKFEEAEKLARRALAIQRKLSRPESAETAVSLTYLSGILWDQRRFDEAETEARESVRILRIVHGNGSELLARALGFLGRALDSQGKAAEAESTLREALAIQKKLFGNEHREVSQTLRFLGGALRRAGKQADAEAILREGVAMQRRVSDQQRSPFLAWALDELAGLLHDQGRSAEAEGLLRESLAIKRVTLGDANPNTIGTGNFLIEVLQAQGKSNEADEVRDELADRPGSPAERNDHP